jgi:signal transduction histidine kinase
VDFLDRLRAYLERVGREPEGLPYVQVDVAAHRRYLLEAIDQVAPGEPGMKLLDRWGPDGPKFTAFVLLTARQILEELAPEAGIRELARLVNVAIGMRLSPRTDYSTTGSIARDHVLWDIAGRAWSQRDKADASDHWALPPHYAFQIRLVQRQGSQVALSQCGRTLLELSGFESVRWLLALEAAQSMGPGDDLRVSSEFAARLLEQTERHAWIDDTEDSWPYSLRSLRRLEALHLLRYHDSDIEHEYAWGYEVFERSKPLLEEIAQRRATPFTVLADALLRDQTSTILGRAHPDAARAVQEGTAATVTLQARMVVHEIRNALVPARTALSLMTGQLGELAQADPVRSRAARIENGIERALAFVDDMLRVANLGAEPPASFDIAAAAREAVAGLSRELNGNFSPNIPESGPSIVGPRSRFVLALSNLLRNAAQAAPGHEGRISLTIERSAEQVSIHVDDNGPGVPAEQRRAIFEPGVALRSGGSGQGLALVRQVIEDEMRGNITCDESPLGGARFTIVLPAGGTRQT